MDSEIVKDPKVKEPTQLELDVEASGWVKKDAYYFMHDDNARTDPKLKAILRKHGAAGYGVWWIIVEMLRSQTGYELPCSDYTIEAIADDSRCEVSFIREFLEMCFELELLVKSDDGERFWSWSLKGRMIPLDNQKKGRRQGGKNSAGKPKSKKKLSTVPEGELSTESPDTIENTAVFHANSKELSSKQLSVQLNETSGSKEEKRKGEESIEDKNSFIVSRGREEPSLSDKARDWISQNILCEGKPFPIGGIE